MAGLMFYHHEDDRWDEHDVTRDRDEPMERRLVLAGMSYIVTEYRDLAWAMTQFALDNPEREQKAAMARHNAALSCYRWAMVAALPMGGPDFVQRMQENAQEYRDSHPEDVEEYMRHHSFHAKGYRRD